MKTALIAARAQEYRNRHDLGDAAPVPNEGSGVTWADAFVRIGSEALDALDPAQRRTGYRGERTQVVIHRDLRAGGTLGPGKVHGSSVHLPDALTRYLCCDAQVRLAITDEGRLLGITPRERVPSRALRRYLERRDNGCRHPLCGQKLWVQQHHIRHWEDGGPTEPGNLCTLCSTCHRALHLGSFTIEGNPEDDTLVFKDRFGRPIEPPVPGPPVLPDPSEPTPFVAPLGERASSLWFTWN